MVWVILYLCAKEKNISTMINSHNSHLKNDATPNKSALYAQVAELIQEARGQVVTQVNTALLATYWNVGRLIVEDEQKSEYRAEYGKQVLKELSKRITYLRIKAGISPFNAPERIGIESAPYFHYEMGRVLPCEEVLFAISRFYKVSPEWLLTGIVTSDYEAQLNNEIAKLDEDT